MIQKEKNIPWMVFLYREGPIRDVAGEALLQILLRLFSPQVSKFKLNNII